MTGACLAQAGHEVLGVDVNSEKVALVNGGRSPVVEPGLGDLVAQVVRAGRLRATLSTEEAVASTEVALLCVGAPARRNGALDRSFLEGVSRGIGSALRHRARRC
ncbi:MAG TPA: GDP-mannose dehydrogenase, partial [Vicinamibacteria bacterium]|nr:GDP-mannose dehydrogenase [Vicinamibacteria bacterium]